MNPTEARAIESRERQSEDARFPVGGYVERQVSDEIDLFELLQSIWQGRLKIALITLLSLVLGVAYVYTATEWFESNFKISAAKAEALFDINNSELVKVAPDKALQEVRKKLLSAENFKNFYLYSSMAQELLLPLESISKEQYAYAVFTGQIKEVLAKVKKGEEEAVDAFTELNFIYPEGVEGGSLLSAYLLWSDEQVKKDLLNSFNNHRDNQLLLNQRKMKRMLDDYERDTEITVIRSTESYKYKRIVLQDQLKALKIQLIKKNQQKILLLNENIAISKRLGYQKPTSPTDVKEVRDSHVVNGAGVEINNGGYSWLDKLPMYYRGFESLEAEKIELNKRQQERFPSAAIVDMEKQLALLEKDRAIEKLQNRKKPEAFLNEYIALEKRNEHLKTLQINVSEVELYELNAKPVASQGSIKPKKLLILVLAAFVGLMLGTLFALIQGASRRRSASL
ncbi:MAG: Wzz/FepE/Etk N-terminal domain-containing protein [Bermanella sp.]